MKTRNLLLVSLLFSGAMLFIAFVNNAEDKDGNTYKTVKIGNQEWISENLNVSTFRNGDPVPEATTDEEWEEAKWEKQPAWCYYDSDPTNGIKSGKLYNWYAVNDARGLAPEGWHIPDDKEWDELTKYLNIWEAGNKIKSASGWKDNGNGTNESGFNGLPGGYRDYVGSFNNIGNEGYWWSSTESPTNFASCRYLDYSNAYINKHNMSKSAGLSVRCLRD